MRPRIFLPQAFAPASVLTLPAPASRHVQVLRLQPGQTVLLFNGVDGAEWPAEIIRIGRNAVEVSLGAAQVADRELSWRLTLALGVPANDRMDALVEKAGELGAQAIQPLVCERSVRSGFSASASRQSAPLARRRRCGERAARAGLVSLRFCRGRCRAGSMAERGGPEQRRVVLSLATVGARADAGVRRWRWGARACLQAVVLSGLEGGLTVAEEAAARKSGFTPVASASRTLRADTAPLALLAWIAVMPWRRAGPDLTSPSGLPGLGICGTAH